MNSHKTSYNRYIIICLIVILPVLVFFSLGIGSESISVSTIIDVITGKIEALNSSSIIILRLRIPRIILSFTVGAVLAVSGLIYQTILKNPLTDPFTLGISSGASFGAAIGVFISEQIFGHRLPLFPFSFIGAAVSIFVIFYFSMKKHLTIFTLIFIGISISFFFNAGMTLILSLMGNRANEVLMWTFGSFTNPPTYLMISIFCIVSILGILFFYVLNGVLDIFYLSGETVKTTGVNVTLFRTLFFVVPSLITAFAVSLTGIIGFVGLITPHIARYIFGHRHKHLIPGAVLIGGILLLSADNVARSVLSLFTDYGRELPVGVITAFIGAPFYLFFLMRYKDGV